MVAYHVHNLRTPMPGMPDYLGCAHASVAEAMFQSSTSVRWVEEGERRSSVDVIQKPTFYSSPAYSL
jgi:hypothetical protein